MDFDDAPVVQASRELYRRTRTLRRWLAVTAALVIPGATLAAAYLTRRNPTVATVVGVIVFCGGVAGQQFLTRWLPRHRARKTWLTELEATYGVSRAEVM